MIKKLLAIILSASLAISLCACGEIEIQSCPDTTPEPEQTLGAENAEDGSSTPEEPSEPESEAPTDSEAAAVTLEDIAAKNSVCDLINEAGTVTVNYTAMNSDGSVYGNNLLEFYSLDDGSPAMQGLYESEEVGTSEIKCMMNEDFAAEYDIYRGFSGSVSVIPKNRYEEQIDAIWGMMYPSLPNETLIDVSEQDGATVVVTFDFDEEYGETYKRSLYYLDESGRIVYKEVTMYLVTENAVPDPETAYGVDTAPVMSIDTYSVQYGADRTLDLTTDSELSEGDVCELTVHITDGDYSETQTISVSKTAVVTVYGGGKVFETYTSDSLSMDDIFDAEDMESDELEIWAVAGEDFTD